MLTLLSLLACGPSNEVVLHVTPSQERAADSFVRHLKSDNARVEVSDDPVAAAGGRGLHIALSEDLDCEECWELEQDGRAIVVHGGDILGVQYGASDALEHAGFRFFHPYDPVVPEELADLPDEAFGLLHTPDMARRGIQMHTLHPIEGLYDFWLPNENTDTERASAVIDWIIKNRGDHVQWVGLDDIEDENTRIAWQAHTGEIIAEAHARGATTSLGVQLFGSGNLQQAFDLLNEVGTEEEQATAIRERMSWVLSDETPFDMINLSFGEFFAEEPESFIRSVDIAVDEMHALSPDVEVTGLIHVGDDLPVEYGGREQIYYFLVRYAESDITPWVHTVMFYNLFDDPGGSYHHDNYDEHRTFLIERLDAGEPVAYFPESAYWVAFDNVIPTYLPIYVKSRFEDLDQIRAQAQNPLQEHVLFSSGWEWGYWQTDRAVLRMNYEHPNSYADEYTQMFSIYEGGDALAELLTDVAESQYTHLLTNRMAPYLASRDSVMEFGYTQDIVSQPVRPGFDDVLEMSDEDYAAWSASDLPKLSAMAADFTTLDQATNTLSVDETDRYIAETLQGVRIDGSRARYIHSLYAAVAAHRDGSDPGPLLAEAEAEFDVARAIVDARHSNFHDSNGERLVVEDDNPTIYNYGYLIRADELCFWTRERAQVSKLLEGSTDNVPGCAL